MQHRILLIGYGNMGREWTTVLSRHEATQIVGVLDLLEQNRERAVVDLGLQPKQVSDNLEALIEQVRPDIVLDCSPPFAHATNTMIALKYGCHVLGEKPISPRIDEAHQIVQAAQQAGKVYMVNQNYRHHPMFVALKNYLATRPLGKIHSIDISYAQNFVFNDTFRYQMDHPLLTDMAIHHFDLVRCITNSSCKHVYCHEFNPSGSRFKNGSSAVAVFEMNDGITFTYQGSWSDISENKSFVGEWRIACEQGILHWDGVSNPEIVITENDQTIRRRLDILDESAFKPENIFAHELTESLNSLISAIASGTQPDTWCGDNIHTLEMVLGAIASAEQHAAISVSTLNERQQKGVSHV